MENPYSNRIKNFLNASLLVFGFLWIVISIFYLLAARAGKAGDFYKDWVIPLRTESFWNYVNKDDSPVLYYFTQPFTYCYYKIFGLAPIPWHLLHVTTHALVCFFIFIIFRKLFNNSNVKNATAIAFGAAILNCISPYHSEVIVHEPCYHYTLSFLMLLINICWLQNYLQTGKKKYTVYAAILYFISTFSLEVFYVTPVLGLLLIAYYRYVLNYNKHIAKEAFLHFTLPAFCLIFLHTALLYFIKGSFVDHYSNPGLFSLAKDVITKTPVYILHIFLLLRFFPDEFKNQAYHFFSTTIGLSVFYLVILLPVVSIVTNRKKISIKTKLIVLLCAYIFVSIVLVSQRWFTTDGYVVYDRYTYFPAPFAYLLFCLVLSNIRLKTLATSVWISYVVVNGYWLLKVNNYWRVSAAITDKLVAHFPNPGNKKVLLLNVPENMHGILMIGSIHEASMFQMMYNQEHSVPLKNKFYDVASYNITSPKDGAHVNVHNDSTIHVALNQPGTWWWFRFLGLSSYENEDYKITTKEGWDYELILKKPSSQFMLVFENNTTWKVVNFNKKMEDQY